MKEATSLHILWTLKGYKGNIKNNFMLVNSAT